MKKFIMISCAVFLLSGCTKTPDEKIADLYQDGVSQIDDFNTNTAD